MLSNFLKNKLPRGSSTLNGKAFKKVLDALVSTGNMIATEEQLESMPRNHVLRIVVIEFLKKRHNQYFDITSILHETGSVDTESSSIQSLIKDTELIVNLLRDYQNDYIKIKYIDESDEYEYAFIKK